MIKLNANKSDGQPLPKRPAETTPINPERTAISETRRDYVSPISGVIGLLIGFMLASYVHEREPFQKQDNQQVIDDKSEKKSNVNKIEAAGSIFVFVYEFQTKTADQELLVRDLRSWSLINKCDFRQFDQDSKDAEPYKIAAEKAGLKSPFLAVVRDKKIVRVFDWPRDRLALEGLVK